MHQEALLERNSNSHLINALEYFLPFCEIFHVRVENISTRSIYFQITIESVMNFDPRRPFWPTYMESDQKKNVLAPSSCTVPIISYQYILILKIFKKISFQVLSCNDDLNKINEHNKPMINSSKLILQLRKIITFKMISPAISEIEASMHSQSAQIWRNFWPVLYQPSKTAGDIILKTLILHSQHIHLLEFIIGSSCSFILLRSSLQ